MRRRHICSRTANSARASATVCVRLPFALSVEVSGDSGARASCMVHRTTRCARFGPEAPRIENRIGSLVEGCSRWPAGGQRWLDAPPELSPLCVSGHFPVTYVRGASAARASAADADCALSL
jgi:hypothetical protein